MFLFWIMNLIWIWILKKLFIYFVKFFICISHSLQGLIRESESDERWVRKIVYVMTHMYVWVSYKMWRHHVSIFWEYGPRVRSFTLLRPCSVSSRFWLWTMEEEIHFVHALNKHQCQMTQRGLITKPMSDPWWSL